MDFGPVMAALGQESLLGINSSRDLAANVNRAAKKRAKENPAYNYRKRPRPVSASFPGGLVVSPAAVLHELGVATTFFTRSPFAEIARHWAHARYCATLTSSGRMLALSREGDDVVYHHKVTQSEQLGIGLALIVAKEVLRRTYRGWDFSVVDADIALKAGFISNVGAIRQAQATKKRPDYFLIGHRVDGHGQASKIFVLECKGTHDGEGFATEQLATACVQVETVEVGNRPPPGLMVASCLSRDAITAHVLDPPGEDDLWSGPEEEMDELLSADPEDLMLSPQIPTPEQFAAKRAALDAEDDDEHEGEELAVPELEVGTEGRESVELPLGTPEVFRIPQDRRHWFFQILTRTAAASALLFAGDTGTAAAYATRRQRGLASELDQLVYEELDQEPRGSTAREQIALIGGLHFRGTVFAMPLPDGRRLEMFRGMEEDLYGLLADGHLGLYLRTADRIGRQWANLAQSASAAGGVVSVGRDGTALRVRVVD